MIKIEEVKVIKVITVCENCKNKFSEEQKNKTRDFLKTANASWINWKDMEMEVKVITICKSCKNRVKIGEITFFPPRDFITEIPLEGKL